MLELLNVGRTWKLFALDGITLQVHAGECVGFFGHNGAGKTLLLETIAGIWVPEQGSITIDGKDVTRLPSEERQVGFVYQELFLFPHLSVRENICYGLRVIRCPRPQREERLDELTRLLHLDRLLTRRNVTLLSGGEKQKVALARALANHPRLLLLDEPAHSLDRDSSRMLHELLTELRTAKRLTMIYVSHNREELEAIADRIVVMERGRIVRVED